MMFAAKAGLKHGMIEGYVHVAMPNDPSDTYKVFKEEFAIYRKLDASLLRDYRSVQALRDRADNSTGQVLLIQAEDAIHAASRFTLLIRNATAPRPSVVGPTPDEVAKILSVPRR
jgi:hypothetical protein